MGKSNKELPPEDIYFYFDGGVLRDYWIWRAAPDDIHYVRSDKAANMAVRKYIVFVNRKLRRAWQENNGRINP